MRLNRRMKARLSSAHVAASSSVGRAAGQADVGAVTACLTSAFFEDPLWGGWAFPDPVSRAERLAPLMRLWTQAGIRHSWVRMTENAEAAAVWIPPGVAELTAAEEATFEALVADVFGARAQEINDLFVLFDEHHPSEELHFYLSLWATHRDHAGRGIGAALLNEDLARIDAARMPVYLESTNPANLARYEGLGFRRLSEFGPADGPVITTMWREAH